MHLTEIDIARYVDDVVPREERDRLEAHLRDCDTCRSSVADVVRLQDVVAEAPELHLPAIVEEEAAHLIEEKEPSPSRWEALPARARYAVAAVLLVGLGVGLWQVLLAPTPDRFRSSTARDAVILRAPSDGAVVQAPPLLRWQGDEDAMTYRVSIYTPEGRLVWQADTTAQRIAAPKFLSCSADDTYVWSVDALLADGTARESPLHAFTCAP